MKISEVRTISEEYEEIGMELIEKHPALEELNRFIKAQRIKLIFLLLIQEKKRNQHSAKFMQIVKKLQIQSGGLLMPIS